ncbi:hypothetical protein LSM04_004549 [Trypanosoma melophagium]|uniref:uncharacterized protein n=1 Tax=Trypanosoma melophagium TaxID=715481 RepID=UPI00351A75BC|nr:hypothetical protein LSM04_004549 [Trypanosoma melophagium]
MGTLSQHGQSMENLIPHTVRAFFKTIAKPLTRRHLVRFTVLHRVCTILPCSVPRKVHGAFLSTMYTVLLGITERLFAQGGSSGVNNNSVSGLLVPSGCPGGAAFGVCTRLAGPTKDTV